MDDVATATKLAIERAKPGIYNIVDDEPAEVSVWLPDLAQAIGAKPPRHIAAWLGRLIIGDAGISMMTKIRGASNAKAKEALGWQPAYTIWRDGFRRGFARVSQKEEFNMHAAYCAVGQTAALHEPIAMPMGSGK